VTLCIYNVSFNLIVYRRFIPVSDGYDSGNFFTVQNGARIATPLLLALAVIELSDVVFAVDSVPAVGLPTFTHGMARWVTSKTRHENKLVWIFLVACHVHAWHFSHCPCCCCDAP